MLESSHSAVIIRDIEVEGVFPIVTRRKVHDVEEAFIVLDRLYADAAPLAEMLGYVVMLGINTRMVGGSFDDNRF